MKYAPLALPRRRLLWPALALGGVWVLGGLVMVAGYGDYVYKAHNRVGYWFIKTENYTAAEWAFRSAIVLKPHFAEAHIGLGFVLKKKGKLEAALAEMREADRVKPDNIEALWFLGEWLDEQGSRAEARVYWERLLKAEKHTRWKGWIKARLAEPD